MKSVPTERMLSRIKELEFRLAESEQLIDAIKAGEVDAFAFRKNQSHEIYTLHSGDYAYRILVENINEGALNLSEDGLIVYTNTYFCDLLHVPYDKIIGNSIFNFIHPSSEKLFKELFEKGLTGKSNGEIILSIGATNIPSYVSLTSLYPTLSTVGMIVTDLTEKKRQELLLKQRNAELTHSKNLINNILQSTNHGVLSYLAIRKQNEVIDFEIQYANDIALKQLDLPAEKVIGKKYLTVIPNAKELGLWDRIVRVLNTGIAESHELTPPGDPIRHFIAYFVPLGDGVTVTFIDITDQKHHAQLLEEKNLQLAKMNEELQTFNFVSSHDLQEPLRKIQLFSSLLLKEEREHLSHNGKTYLDRMQKTAERMQMLIGDLLAYFQIKNAKTRFERTDLNDILAESLTLFEESIKEKGAAITFAGLCEIDAVPFQLRQLFQNLLGNALKFSSPHRQLQLTINCEKGKGAEFSNPDLSPGIEYCHIIFEDNGIGFAAVYNERIFEAFQRLHEYDEYKGTGIGLAICKTIVENHRGIIKASGILNEGARFDIFIPMNRV